MEFIPGPMELVIILIIVAMLFGVGRLPEVFGAVGKGIREFRREMSPAQAPTKTVAQQPTEKVVTTNTTVVDAPEPIAVNQPAEAVVNPEA